MAKAGFCSECGENVYLTEGGGCVKGHGAECVSAAYDVPDAPAPATEEEPAAAVTPEPVAPAPLPAEPAAPAAAYAPPAYVPPPAAPPAYEPPSYAAAAPATPPKKKRTGLIIAIAVAALLLLCGCAIAGIVALANSGDSTGTVSKEDTVAKALAQEKAKTEAAWTMMKGLALGDAEAVKRSVPSETLEAMPEDTWPALVEASKSEGASVVSETWTKAVLVAVTSSPDGGGATITLTPSKPDKLSVEAVSAKEGRDPLVITFGLIDEDGTFKVVSMSSDGETIGFDKKSMLEAVQD